MTETNEIRFKLSENAWLALIPVVATYLAFLFQSSYLGYFGVPISMVDVDIPKIIFAMVPLTLATVFLLMLFAYVADLLRSQNPIVQIIGNGLAVITIFLPLILASTDIYTVKQQVMYSGLLLCAWLLNFWPPAQKAGESKSYLERLKEQEARYATGVKPKNIKQVIGQNVLTPFFLTCLFSIYVMMLGTYCASVFGGSTYLKENPNALYVGKANGSYIFTIVNPQTNTFGDQILLIDSGSKLELVHTNRDTTKRATPKKLSVQAPTHDAVSGSPPLP